MALLHSDVRKILEVLDHAKYLDHVEITIGDYILKAGKSAPVAAAESVSQAVRMEPTTTSTKTEPPTAKANMQDIPEGMIAVRSPMAGSFYLTPSPDEPAFVNVGDKIVEGDTVCLVEVMKMFNSVPAPISGTVRRIIANHSQTVAMGEIILILEPETTK